MKELFSKKIAALHKNMMQCYEDTQHYSSSIIGSEREIFQRELLAKILPHNYRVGAGTICDSSGKETGQIDCVIELPFSLSFPISSDQNRLYLADTIGAAFEIKSDLSRKWPEAIAKIAEIKALNRFKLKSNAVELLDTLKIPCFIIAYRGFSDLEEIYEKLTVIQSKDRPEGVLIIENGLYIGRSHSGLHYEVLSPKAGLLAFVSCLYQVLQTYTMNVSNLDDYQDLLDEV